MFAAGVSWFARVGSEMFVDPGRFVESENWDSAFIGQSSGLMAGFGKELPGPS